MAENQFNPDYDDNLECNECRCGYEERIAELQAKLDKHRKILDSWHIQYRAAMHATSLGLCKRVIKHAWEDEQALEGE